MRHRDRIPWWAEFVLIPLTALIFLGVSAGMTPRLANGVAYVVGAGGTDTFIAQGHGQDCGRGGRRGYTTGILEHSGLAVHWPGTVPVGSSFPVRAPVWAVAGGGTIISNTGDAIVAITQTLVLYALTSFVWGAIIFQIVGWRRGRREADPTPHRPFTRPRMR